MREFVINKKEEGLTVYKYSVRILNKAPGGMIRKFLRNKNIEFNHKRSDGSEKISAGDTISFFLSDETFEKFSAGDVLIYDGPLPDKKRIIYEDEDFLFYDKPAGMLSQSDSSHEISLNDRLLAYKKATMTVKPSVCNRLDKNTSGLVLCGLSIKGLQTLDSAIHDRRIKKVYRFIAEGEFNTSGRVRLYIKKDRPGNKAFIYEKPVNGADEVLTDFNILKSTPDYTYAEALLITGKTHQIRAVSSYLGHPIAGDIKYGAKKGRALRQLLHSYIAAFPDDILDGREFKAPLPGDMEDFIKKYL